MPEKLLLFGDLPTEYLSDWEITQDLAQVEAKLGVRFELVPTSELLAREEALDEAELKKASLLVTEMYESAIQHADAVEIAEAETLKATRLYVAMDAIRQEQAGNAVTIVCQEVWGDDRATPCVALSLFQVRGIPAACQGDIDALLTMVLFKRVTGWTSFMGGAHDIEGTLAISHCVLSRRICGPDAPAQPYYMSNYHGRKPTPTIGTEVPKGTTVTLARLTRDAKSLLLTQGTVIGAGHGGERLCRNRLLIDVADRDRVLDAVKGHQAHYVVAVGDHVQTMGKLADNLGIPVIQIDTQSRMRD